MYIQLIVYNKTVPFLFHIYHHLYNVKKILKLLCGNLIFKVYIYCIKVLSTGDNLGCFVYWSMVYMATVIHILADKFLPFSKALNDQ